jgi:hypothetical protein
MTEAVNPSYETLRDGVENSTVRAAWREGDRWASYMGEQYQAIATDETLSAEGRKFKEEQVREKYLPKVTQAYTEAREKALAEAKSAVAMSIPLPDEDPSECPRQGRHHDGSYPERDGFYPPRY